MLGSNSFAGAFLIDHLLTKSYEVAGVSRSAEPHPALLAYTKNKNIKAFQFYQYDLNHHFDALIKLINQFKPQVIVDLAGQGMVAESWKTPEQWYQTNIVSKVRLHNHLNQCDFLDRYVRVSTPEVYGSTLKAVNEEQAFNPSTPYAVSHAAIDMSLLAFYKQYQFPVILTRFANFYGPCQQLYRVIPRTIIYGLTGKKMSLHGGGLSERAFIYGNDVASGIECAVQKGSIGDTYHFSAGDTISIANLVRKICGYINVDFDIFSQTTQDRPGKDAVYLMDSKKAKNKLGWNPTMPLENGLMKTIDWIRENIEVIKDLPLDYMHKA